MKIMITFRTNYILNCIKNSEVEMKIYLTTIGFTRNITTSIAQDIKTSMIRNITTSMV
jgi:hypothetical protein